MLPAAETNPVLTESLTSAADNKRVTMLVLRTHEVYQLTRYRIDGDVLTFEQVDGSKGAVDLSQVDWRKTSEMTSQVQSEGLWQISGQLH